MSNIIKFPKENSSPEFVSVQDEPTQPKEGFNAKGEAFLSALLRSIWIMTVLMWPILKWVLSIEVFFQFVRMLYHWNTSNVSAGWTFLLHFAVLTALTYFVSIYKPKGI